MKKIIIWMMLMALMLTSAAAFAEEAVTKTGYATGFSLREGLTFGATSADITAAEKLTVQSGAQLTVYGQLQYAGTVAGIDNSRVGYFMDSSDRLYEMYYRFEPVSNENCYEMYDYLYSMLVEKYGEPLEDLDGGYRAVAGTLTQKAGPWNECTEWLLEVEDCYVKIDLTMVNREIVAGTGVYIRFVWIDYTSLTADEVSSIMNEQEAEKQAILDEL